MSLDICPVEGVQDYANTDYIYNASITLPI